MGTDLRQQALGQISRRLLEEDSPESQAAPNGLFDNPQSFNGAVAALGEFRLRKRVPDFFHERVVASFDPSQTF